MSNVKFELNSKGLVSEVLEADWMQAFITSEAEKRIPEGYHAKSFIKIDRAQTTFYPNTRQFPE